MKRLLGFLISLSLLGGAAHAQTAVPATGMVSSSKMTATKMSHAPATTTHTITSKTGMMGSTAHASSKNVATKMATSSKMKADGTPDMSYKENKMTKTITTTGKMKADGTPDMRYKANKTTVTTKKTM